MSDSHLLNTNNIVNLDTYLSDNYVTQDTAQIITGTKTISSRTMPVLYMKNSSTPDSSDHYAGRLQMRDGNNKTVGNIQSFRKADGWSSVQMQVWNTSGQVAQIAVYQKEDGTYYTYCPSSTETTSTSSQQIATVGWSNTNLSRTDLTNSPYTTNRIMEIPQNIKLELNNGTLTLKAGSKVYVPNGFEQDGTTPKFDVVVIENDVIQTNGFNTQHDLMYEPSKNKFAHFIQGYNLFSGTTDPTGVPTTSCNYNTTLNKIRITLDGGSSWSSVDYSLPFAITTSNSSQYTSIDQIFNGFGYIGSTVFVLPGLKVQSPNGKNADGTNKNNVYQSTNVSTNNIPVGNVKTAITLLSDGKVSYYNRGDSIYYDAEKNLNIRGYTNTATDIIIADIEINSSDAKILNWYPKTVDSVVNSNMSNISSAGKSFISGMGMPSSKYEDWTLLASGQTYTAPANGWLTIRKSGTSGQLIAMENTTGGRVSYMSCLSLEVDCRVSCPAKKGDVIQVWYNTSGTTYVFRFVYAEGETNV